MMPIAAIRMKGASAGGGGTGPFLGYAEAVATAHTTLGASWTDIVGCTLSLAAGTWLLEGRCPAVNTSSTSSYLLKIYNATDAIDYIGGNEGEAGGFGADLSMLCIVVIAGTKSIRLAGSTNGAYDAYDKLGTPAVQSAIITASQLA